MKTLKVARMTKRGDPVYDCHVFAVDDSYISGEVNINGDFFGGKRITVRENINAEGMVIISDQCEAVSINAGEGIDIGNNADTVTLKSHEDIIVGDKANLADVCSYSSVRIGDSAKTKDIEVWTVEFELGPNEQTGRIRIGK